MGVRVGMGCTCGCTCGYGLYMWVRVASVCCVAGMGVRGVCVCWVRVLYEWMCSVIGKRVEINTSIFLGVKGAKTFLKSAANLRKVSPVPVP